MTPGAPRSAAAPRACSSIAAEARSRARFTSAKTRAYTRSLQTVVAQ